MLHIRNLRSTPQSKKIDTDIPRESMTPGTEAKNVEQLGIEPRTSPMLREHYTTKPQPQLVDTQLKTAQQKRRAFGVVDCSLELIVPVVWSGEYHKVS
ncbi:hypothetical protein BDW69DRAFT_169855 [Aspergillus filifer]